MGLKSFEDLNEVHKDFLKEIVNIGSGSAAMALSEMLRQPVDIAVPMITMLGYDEAYEELGGAEAVMVGILLMLSSGLEGMMMFLLPAEVAFALINQLMDSDIHDISEIDELAYSVICELANIMTGAFVNAISEMAGMPIDISPPSSTVDMLGSIMSVPAIYYAEMGDRLMLMKNDLVISGKKTPANILLLPDAPSLTMLMGSFGVEV